MAQLSASASASSSASSHSNYKCDIFINHHGQDVKKTFASHLYRRLLPSGLQVFLDQQFLQRGENSETQIKAAIATASVHVAIFSPGYAESRWCLDELVHMLKSMESGEATIIPVFYNVKPYTLRWTHTGTDNDAVYVQGLRILRRMGRDRLYAQALRILRSTGRVKVYAQALRFLQWIGTDRVYAQALLNHEKKGRYDQERLAAWKKALSDVSYISGFELEACNGDEGELADKVAQQVQKKVRKPPLEVATHPTGLDDKLQDFERTVISEQQQHRGGPNVVGIVGLGGVGKTTLAKLFFNRKRSDYHQSCFLPDVRDAAARCLLPSLQSKLYKDLTGRDQLMDNVDEGIAMLRSRLSCRQALIILDDVDDVEQLHALYSPLKDVLPSGSLITVTSRNQEVLTMSGIRVSSIYKMTGLDEEHSQVLFCLHAFNQRGPVLGFEEVVGKFLEVCVGLPLSLKVLGAQHHGKELEYWNAQLRKISRSGLPTDIKNRLKVSYDSLDKEEKNIFLDIACFFIGIKRDTAIRIWEGSGWEGWLGLRNLEYKCLVEIDSENCIRMHDHLRDLGRDLAEREPPGCPRRFWRPTDKLFRDVPAQSTVRGISIVQQRSGESFQNPAEFSNRIGDMSGLQLLRASGDCLGSIFKVLREPELFWLRCDYRYPYSSLPSWIPINKLRVLEINNLEVLEVEGMEKEVQILWLQFDRYPYPQSFVPPWMPIQTLVLNLKTRAEETLPTLETLWETEIEAPSQLRELNVGVSLLRVPKSIAQLKHLEKIELHSVIETLPEEFFHLRSLKHLRLGARMMSLPDSFGNLTNLLHIDLSRCDKLLVLPSSFGKLTRLQHLSLEYCSALTLSGETFGNISTLQRLNLSHCYKIEGLPLQVTHQRSLVELILNGTELKELSSAIGDLSNLEILELGCPPLEMLPASLGNLRSLKKLRLQCCYELKFLPDSVGGLKWLKMLEMVQSGIEYLPVSVTELDNLEILIVNHCPLREVPFDGVEKVQGGKEELPDPRGRRLLDSSTDKCMLRLTYLDLAATTLKKLSFHQGVCPNLQTLHLSDCHDLVQVGALPTTLISLNLYGCCGLKKITGLRGLEKLRALDIGLCKKVKELPGFETLISLEEFRASGSRIKKMSFPTGVCPNLPSLDMMDCLELEEFGALPTTLISLNLYGCCALKKITGLCGLAKLRKLNICGCKEIEELPGLETLISLEEFRASGTRIKELSFPKGVCPNLQRLEMKDCVEAGEVGALPTTLISLYLSGCGALNRITGLSGLAKLQTLDMRGCYKVEELPGLETLKSLQEFRTSSCENMKRIRALAGAAKPESDILKKVIELMETQEQQGWNLRVGRRIQLKFLINRFRRRGKFQEGKEEIKKYGCRNFRVGPRIQLKFLINRFRRRGKFREGKEEINKDVCSSPYYEWKDRH